MKSILEEPARITSTSSTCLDNFLINFERSFSVAVKNYCFSDHYCQIISIDILNYTLKDTTPSCIRSFSEEHIEDFRQKLSQETWLEVYNENSVDRAFENFRNTFMYYFNLCFPFRRVRISRKSDKNVKTPELETLKKYVTLYHTLAEKDDKYREITLTNGLHYFRRFHRKTPVDAKSTMFNVIPTKIRNLKDEDTFKVKVKKQLTFYFVDEFRTRYLLERYDNELLLNNSFKLQAVDNSVVLTILSGIKSSATGDDGLDTVIIKLCFPHILLCFGHIINFCISHSVYPSKWKKAVMMPLPKRPFIEDYKDLRAVSIPPVLSKLIGKVALQLMEYVERKHILPDVQPGFRQKHSFSTALSQIIDDVLAASDMGEFTALILLGFTRGFETLDHKLLLHILKHIEIDRHSTTFFRKLPFRSEAKSSIKLKYFHFFKFGFWCPTGLSIGSTAFYYTGYLPKPSDKAM
nr:unnamed protein product [Callosobruchus analis]